MAETPQIIAKQLNKTSRRLAVQVILISPVHEKETKGVPTLLQSHE